ncbi:MAG TPA: CoA-binding protein [Mycobacterium sp.]
MQLKPLFQPESIAIIGASDKPTPGRRVIATLECLGFAGRVYPVNPNYTSLLNRPCYASPAELPEVPDVAVFCLGHERVLPTFIAAAERGMKAAVIFDGGFAEYGTRGAIGDACPTC